MSLYRLLAVASLAPILSGCLNTATLVKVKPDGSGTIEQTLLVNRQALKGVMAGMGGSGEIKESGAVNEAEFKRGAERMGARPVSLTPIKEGSFEGTRAIYAFDDISKIRIDQDPQMGAATGGAQPSMSNNPIRFSLTKQGGVSELTIAFDDKAVSAATAKSPPVPESIDPAMLQMIKGVFQGFKIAIDLEIDGTIVKTNADYVTGSRITLLELDLGQLLENEEALKALQSKIRPGVSIAEVKPFLKDVKGVKINHPTVSVEYR